MNKIFMFFLVLLISILSVGCICAAEVENTAVTDSSAIDDSFDVDDSFSQDSFSENSIDEGLLMEAPKDFDLKPMDSDVPEDEKIPNYDSLVSNDTDENIDDSCNVTDENPNDSGSDIPGPKIKPDENITVNGPKLDIKGPTIQVPLNISGPKGYLINLQDEIDNAPAGSTVRLWMDYVATLSAFMVKINKDLTIDGRGKTIDCQNVQCSGAFLITSGNVILKNLRIINSQNPYQGSGTVSIDGSAQCTLINCTFEKNWGRNDGSVICNKALNPLSIINCSFSNNECGDCGIVWSAGVLNVTNSSFDSNSAYVKGGALYSKSDINIFNSSFKSNNATKSFKKCYGGAVCSEGNVHAVNSKFIGNKVLDFGGAICAEKDVILENCLLESNVANMDNDYNESFGGAVYSNGTVYGTNSTFKNNTVVDGDGEIFAANDVILEDCFFESDDGDYLIPFAVVY